MVDAGDDGTDDLGAVDAVVLGLDADLDVEGAALAPGDGEVALVLVALGDDPVRGVAGAALVGAPDAGRGDLAVAVVLAQGDVDGLGRVVAGAGDPQRLVVGIQVRGGRDGQFLAVRAEAGPGGVGGLGGGAHRDGRDRGGHQGGGSEERRGASQPRSGRAARPPPVRRVVCHGFLIRRVRPAPGGRLGLSGGSGRREGTVPWYAEERGHVGSLPLGRSRRTGPGAGPRGEGPGRRSGYWKVTGAWTSYFRSLLSKWSARVTTAQVTSSPQTLPSSRVALTKMSTLKVPPVPNLELLANRPPNVLLIQCEAPVEPDSSWPPRQGWACWRPGRR